MDTKEILLKLRTKSGFSQDELAEKLFVTRQAVSRWENGDTVPNTETLKLLSKLYNVSINTLLGSPRELICQCCGMPLEDEIISREKDGFMNEDYCKWCYADGNYMYSDMDDLIDVCVKNMANEEHSEKEVREYLLRTLPKLDYWKRYKELGGNKAFEEFKNVLIDEINALNVDGMPLEDEIISREKDGFMNEDYCKWCYADGNYMYSDMDDLIDVCVKNMANEEHSEKEVREYLLRTLPKLDYWKRYKELGGNKAFEEFKNVLIDEINALNVDGMPKLTKLNALVGKFVNLGYRLPNGSTVKFLDDNATYLGNQLECEFGGDRYFGIVVNTDFILISTYEENLKNPELVLYKKR